MLEIGQSIPAFEGGLQTGEIVSNRSLLGSKYILFFYPQDDSPSCTKEACSVRDHYRDIKKLGYLVFGVSPDTVKKHQNFINKYELQYPLIVDTDRQIIESFGLWGPKKFMGRDIIGVYRTTLIIDESGMISGIISDVKTKDHGRQITDLIRSLSVSGSTV